MSRCFPFRPPGYERKTTVNDPDLLKKEKHKEKKHKKEKDKEKKEGKEKREKERSDEKHKEKKDKKDKHRDKKKEKEKDRDKDKHKVNDLLPDKKRVMGPPEVHVHKPSEKSKDMRNDKDATLAEKRAPELSAFQNEALVSKNNHLASKSFKQAPELGRRSTEEERRTIHQLPGKNVVAERKKDEGVVKLAGNGTGPLVDAKEKKEKSSLDGSLCGRGVIMDARSGGNALVANSVGMVSNRVEGIARPMEKTEQRVEGKEKIRGKDGDVRKEEKRKEKDREKSILKDKDREKEKKKEYKVMATSEQKQLQITRMKNGSENHMPKPSAKEGNKHSAGAQSVALQNTPKDSSYGAATHNNNLGKRKDSGLNGTYDELVTGPNKLARTAASTHPLTENGRSLEHCQNSAAFAPGAQRPPMNIKVDRTFAPDDTQRPPMNIKVDGKEQKINGTASEPLPLSSQKTANVDRKSDALSKPPHQDTKYLSQILSVPKMDPWSDYDDQEWLFNSNSSPTRKPKFESSETNETPQVWARALWLDQVDVYALPYVVPH